MVELSLEQAFSQAEYYVKRGEVSEAQKFYKAILTAVPNNEKAQAALTALHKVQASTNTQSPPQEIINQLLNLYNSGNLEAVVKQASSLTEQYPYAFVVWNILGAAHRGLGDLNKASQSFKKVTELNPNFAEGFNNLGAVLKDQEKLDEAVEAFNKALSLKPDYADAHYNMGGALQEHGKLDEAVEAFNKALTIKPEYAEAYNNMGVTLKEQGKLEKAIASYNKALSLKPDYAQVYNNMGNALKDQGKLEEAIEAYSKALSLKPDYAEAYNNMGTALKDQGKLNEAIGAYNKALSLKYDYAEAYHNMGVTLQDQGKLEEAITSFNKALSLKPGYAEAHNNMGNAHQDQGKQNEAIEAYNNALAIKPDYAEAYNNMGIAFKKQGKQDKALEAFNKAIAIKPDYARAYNNMGATLNDHGKLEEAIEALNKAIAIKPDYEASRASKLYLQALICDWDNIAEDVNLIPRLGTSEEDISPFALLSLEDAPDTHFTRSKIFAKAKFPQKPLPLLGIPSQMPKRLRIGYFSADFHEHATMYLMAQIFTAHDKAQYEIFAYSYGSNSHSAMQNRLINEVDTFHDISQLNNTDIIELVLREKLDVAVDLKGYTKDSKTNLFSYRLAPIQINYLGYPGTLGADFIDYIVADSIVIPEDKQQHYSEQVMYLPHTYQPNDNTRAISQKVQTREDMGLPSDGFVFCCFNNNYKISPKEFGIWMRLMTKVEGSVLWLLKSNKWAEQNLKKEAEARGISADRVIFAERVENSEHLARHRLADLFLDTFNSMHIRQRVMRFGQVFR